MLLLAVVAVVAIVWVLIAQPWRSQASTPAPEVSRSASATPSVSPSPSEAPAASDAVPGENADAAPEGETDAGLPACGNADVSVEALTDQSGYAADQNPQLSIRLTNTSAEDCTLNVGTTGQSFTITSGNDTWWRSTDCQSEPSDMVVTLAAGQSVTSATPVTWDRTRSSVDTCQNPNRAKAPAGGASYHLAVAIGGIPSGATAQFLLE